MPNFFKTVTDTTAQVAKNITNNSLWLLRWCVNHPQIILLLIGNYILIPILAAESKRMFWKTDCGTFESMNPIFKGNPPSGLFQYQGHDCFLPFKYRDVNTVFCYLGNTNIFYDLPDDSMGVDITNTGVTICQQFTKLMEK